MKPSSSIDIGRRTFTRATLGGVLMGLANLVPGISGGTMLLAAGIYTQFIEAIAEVTRLRLRLRSLALLAIVGGSAGLGILLLAGALKGLVVEHRWVMYSLFVGLTLGGLPLVWELASPVSRKVWSGAGGGFLAMVGLTLAQAQPAGEAVTASNAPLLVLAGIAGASAMILPGVSGGYLLLILGQYLPVLGAIDRLKEALQAADLQTALEPTIQVLIPVGIGVAVGVALVSNLLRVLLRRFEKVTLGVLLGLLVGAVVGLWPFQRPIEPVYGETVIRGQIVTEENAASFETEDLPTERFRPTPLQAGTSLLLVLGGLATTLGVSRIGAKSDDRQNAGGASRNTADEI